MTSVKHVAFIGLGAMGYPMAGHLAAAGHTVTVFNRTRESAQRWHDQYGGRVAATPAEAAEGQDAVMLCVGNDDDVREVTCDTDGVLHALPQGSLLIDHTTTSQALAIAMAEQASTSGVDFLDAPVSGGQIGAETGTLTIMVGADEDAHAAAEPLMACYAKSIRRMGGVGSGQLTKMVNQICIAGLLQGLSEGLHFAERAGLDVAVDLTELLIRVGLGLTSVGHLHAPEERLIVLPALPEQRDLAQLLVQPVHEHDAERRGRDDQQAAHQIRQKVLRHQTSLIQVNETTRRLVTLA